MKLLLIGLLLASFSVWTQLPNPRKARKLARKLDHWIQSLNNPRMPGNPNQSEKEWYDFYFPEMQ